MGLRILRELGRQQEALEQSSPLSKDVPSAQALAGLGWAGQGRQILKLKLVEEFKE